METCLWYTKTWLLKNYHDHFAINFAQACNCFTIFSIFSVDIEIPKISWEIFILLFRRGFIEVISSRWFRRGIQFQDENFIEMHAQQCLLRIYPCMEGDARPYFVNHRYRLRMMLCVLIMTSSSVSCGIWRNGGGALPPFSRESPLFARSFCARGPILPFPAFTWRYTSCWDVFMPL